MFSKLTFLLTPFEDFFPGVLILVATTSGLLSTRQTQLSVLCRGGSENLVANIRFSPLSCLVLYVNYGNNQ